MAAEQHLKQILSGRYFFFMIITQSQLDDLTAQAKVSPRLRCNLDLRNSAKDHSQRMLNALEPGTVLLEAKDGAWEPLGEEDILER